MEQILEELKMRKEIIGNRLMRLERDPINNAEKCNAAWKELREIRKQMAHYKGLEAQKAARDTEEG